MSSATPWYHAFVTDMTLFEKAPDNRRNTSYLDVSSLGSYSAWVKQVVDVVDATAFLSDPHWLSILMPESVYSYACR